MTREAWWITIPKAFIVINVVMVFFALTTWLERKLLGRMQNRYGPNRAGPKGLLVPIADLLKLIRKEAFAPVAVYRLRFGAYITHLKLFGICRNI
ncbi:MAG TPA: NADH-quinone oxidoreductase subunit H, partial [Gaiellaceae bacterium]|nr:NADH-quinone oxidoreductase subunit H [Gaiellaceae bacterium]